MSFVRRTPLVNNEFYHVFNRGVARTPTFASIRDYKHAMLSLAYYRFANPPFSLSHFKELSAEEKQKLLSSMQNADKLVEINSFVLMPNHFHFLLKQLQNNGISKFISQFTNSYTRFFNTVHERVGPLYQGVFKSVHIETDEQLIHVSRYIHLNPVVSNVIREEDLRLYPWSSLQDYLSGYSKLVQVEPIMQHFKTSRAYKKFVFDYIGYAKELEKIKHLIIEE